METFCPPPPRPWLARSWWRSGLSAGAPTLLTVVLATAVWLVGLRGVDQAAQAYRVLEFRAHGFMLWDAGWYGGNFPMGYSVLFPTIAAVFGLAAVAIGSAALATWSFDRVVSHHLGARPLGTWYFCISTLLPVAIGQLPFLAGEALGLASLVALQKRRRRIAVPLGLLAALCSPLAAAFLAMVCLAWAVHSSRGRRWLVATAGASLAVILVIGVLFPGAGPMPFPWTGLVVTELLCLTVLTPLVRTTPVVRLGALIYAAATIFSFLVPNPLGGNAPRLAASIGVPLLACFVTAPGPALDRLSGARVLTRLTGGRRLALGPRWRVVAVAMVIPFMVWQWAPGQKIVSTSDAPSTQASFYQPLIDEIAALQAGPIRIEVVPTFNHWEAAFVAPHVSLARGWERQLDVADNPIFYTPGLLTPAAYESWLDTSGISYVALPATRLDYSGQMEAQLLQMGQVAGLTSVWQTPEWQLWKVTGSPGLVSGPATLTSVAPDHLSLQVEHPGQLTVRVRYNAYWTVTEGAACLSRSPSGWISVNAHTAGALLLSTSVLRPASAPPPYCPPSP